MKKILLLTTGGTIASVQGEDGLAPEAAPTAFDRIIREYSHYYEIQSRNILNLDSSNIQSEEWRLIAHFLAPVRRSREPGHGFRRRRRRALRGQRGLQPQNYPGLPGGKGACYGL